MPSPDPDSPDRALSLTSQEFQFTFDEGQESFFALCIEDENCETAWIISDTVRSLDNLR